MTEEQKAKFWQLAQYTCDCATFAGEDAANNALEAYVTKLVADAYQAGRAVRARKRSSAERDLRAMCEAWQSEDANTCNAIAGRVLGNEQVTT